MPLSQSTSRAVPALIFLTLSVACFFSMDMISLIRDFPPPTATGFIEWSDGKFPILDKYHWFRPLDPIIREITVGFAPSSFGYDDVSRWQVMNFIISDPGIFYLIWGCESMREAITGGPIYYPGIIAFIAQFGGGGVIIPIYYALYMAFTTPLLAQPRSKRKIDMGGAALWALLSVILHVIPAFGIMFDTTLEGRHQWTWFWQLYSARISLSWYAITFGAKFIPRWDLGQRTSYRKKTTMILVPFIGLAVSLWAYTLLYCPYPMSEVFFPHQLAEDTWVLRMRRILQFDQLFIFGSSILWISLDSRRNGIGNGVGLMIVGIILAILVSPGASFGILWLWREWQLLGDERVDISKKA